MTQTTAKKHAKPTATETYRLRAEMANRIMAQIAKILTEHAVEAEANPLNWGYVGDLGRVNEELAQVLAALGDRSAVDELGITY